MEWLCRRGRVGHEESLQPVQPRLALLAGQLAGEAETGVGLEGESFRWLTWRPGCREGGGGGGVLSRDDEETMMLLFLFFVTRGAARFTRWW